MPTYNSIQLAAQNYVVRKVAIPPIQPPTQGQLWPRGDKRGGQAGS